jgi:tetratricopeptide (TPR) repeat protein
LARSANREALTFFEQALEALQHLPDSPDTRAQAIDLRLDLRNALWTLGELEWLFTTLQEAEGLGDPHRLGWVSVYLLAHFAQACDPDRALASGQRALEFSQARQERGHAAYALWLLGEVTAQRQPPEIAQATTHYQQALTLAEELGMRPLMAPCHLGLGTLYRRLGRAQLARAALER